MALVGGATILGQGALVLASPVLSRLYDPDAFGLYSVYAAVLAVLVAVASLRFDFAIPIADDVSEAIHLFVASVALALVASLVFALVLILWGATLANLIGATAMTTFLWLLPVGLIVMGVAQALAGWAVFNRLFPALARWRTMQGIGQATLQLALGVIHAGPIGLVLGDQAGRVVGISGLRRSIADALNATPISRSSLRQHAARRWGFARIMTTASLLNALTTQIPFLLIPAVFGLGSSGQYFLAYRMLVLPSSLVSAAFNQVFFGEASFRRADGDRLHDLTLHGAVALLVFSIPTYSIVAVSGSALITLVFGSQWEDAGLYAQVIAPSLVLWSVTHPLSSLLLVGRRERESLAFTAMELLLKSIALGIGIVMSSLIVGIALLSLVSILLGIASLWRFLRVASVGLSELVRPSIRIAVLTLPSLCVVLATETIAPAAVPLAAAAGWAVAIALSARFSGELRALLSGSSD